MKIKVTNTQTIELPNDMDPEAAAAFFQNPGVEDIDGEEPGELDDDDGVDEDDVDDEEDEG